MNLIQSIFVLFLSYFLTLRIGKYFQINQVKVTAIFALRTIVSIIYMQIAKSLEDDSYGYFAYALEQPDNLPYFSTSLITNIIQFLRKYLDLNIFSTTFLFSFIGIIGVLALASNINQLTKNSSRNIKFLSKLVSNFCCDPILT